MILSPLIQPTNPCCRNKANWAGHGTFGAIWPIDPSWWHGWRSCRDVVCFVCGEYITTEYSQERVPDEILSDDEPYAWLATKMCVEQIMHGHLPVIA